MSSRASRAELDRVEDYSAEARLRDLIEQQSALRELAIAVAEMRAPEVIYELVAKQAAGVAGVDSGAVVRFRVDGVGEVVGSWRMGSRHTGSLIPLDSASGAAVVARTGRSARVNTSETLLIEPASVNDPPASLTLPGSVAVPIRVLRELWGSLLVVVRSGERVPPDLEERLGTFADLVGLAITNTDTSARLLSQATSDPLTGLLNHRAFQERVESEVGRAQRYGRPLTLVLLDLDYFKSINDAYGHQAGDAALMHAARILELCARAGDVLGRIGGDEFALLLPETSAEQALPIAERWAGQFRAAPVGVAAHLTMSAGVSDLTHANGSRELFRLADGALYWAKSQGRDTVVVYSPDTVYEFSDSDRLDRLERMQSLSAIRALARVIDAKDSPDDEHSERVASFVRRLAEAAGWAPARVALLAEAAQIHDVGKICVPKEVLRKPSRLTAEEFELVKMHAAVGADMAREALTGEQVLWLGQHLERVAGAGYPRGLAGTEISEGADLLALADSWDAMTTERVYSRPKPEPEALAECFSLAGSQFSPAACEALNALA
ncbi:MAG: diguanylate cyclase [Gaiellaceae bacterium]